VAVRRSRRGVRRPGIRPDATLGFVAAAFRRHAELLVEFFEDEGADAATSASTSPGTSRATRSAEERAALATASSLAEIDDLLATLDLDAPTRARRPRAAGPCGHAQAARPARRWLDTREMAGDDARTLADAELDTSGG
jgi:hypothetical protein